MLTVSPVIQPTSSDARNVIRAAKLFGVPDPPYRMRCLASLKKGRVFLFIESGLAVQLGHDHTRVHVVHTNPLRRELERRTPGELIEAPTCSSCKRASPGTSACRSRSTRSRGADELFSPLPARRPRRPRTHPDLFNLMMRGRLVLAAIQIRSSVSIIASRTCAMRSRPRRARGPFTIRLLSIARIWSTSRSDLRRRRPQAGTRIRSGSASSTRFVVKGTINVDGCSTSRRA